MPATRADVVQTFPELANPNWKHPDNTGETNEDMIAEWIKYWNTMEQILQSRRSK